MGDSWSCTRFYAPFAPRPNERKVRCDFIAIAGEATEAKEEGIYAVICMVGAVRIPRWEIVS